LILDPLLPALRNAQQLVLVPDDLLHLVPIDALPADADGVQLLGDRFVVETRATLGELVYPSTPASGADGLVGIGGVWYGADRGAARGSSAAAIGVTSGKGETPGNLSCETPIERDFQSLPGTLTEIEGVRSVFAMVTHSEQNTTVLSGEKATVQALLETAPRARWLHIATHGWFASESIPSWADPRPIDEQSGLVPRQSPEETVKGLSPMLLCGLALAGANKPEDAAGRAPGLLTADELSALDLSNCELAVLSACDTARGELRRAGQGVASLQMAMQMAGARSVLTSLWSVPDEATKILMLDFYRQLWVEKKPKWQALWEAKKGLRDAKDASGKPKYSTRDWAAWVLTGNPN
jgi:CHAT domain-containing protein